MYINFITNSRVQCVARRSHRRAIFKATQDTLTVPPHVHRNAQCVRKCLKMENHCGHILESIIIQGKWTVGLSAIFVAKFMTLSYC